MAAPTPTADVGWGALWGPQADCQLPEGCSPLYPDRRVRLSAQYDESGVTVNPKHGGHEGLQTKDSPCSGRCFSPIKNVLKTQLRPLTTDPIARRRRVWGGGTPSSPGLGKGGTALGHRPALGPFPGWAPPPHILSVLPHCRVRGRRL